jgi:type IV pilus assembly protein PilA
MNARNNHIQRGFSLIELMIVIAIIGVIAAIALPTYQAYVARTQVAEAFSISEGPKVAISEECQLVAACSGVTATTASGKYADVTSDASGQITATMKATAHAAIAGSTIVQTPTLNAGSVTWACSGTVASQYRPTSCS